MDITNSIVSRRNDALLVAGGDYGSYRRQLSRRLLTLRRRLGRVSPKGRKYSQKSPITPEDISNNPEFVSLILLTSERAWAHAMHMKYAADASEKAITGSTRTHIISRLEKARKHATHLVELLENGGHFATFGRVLLEARAYAAMLHGTIDFESHKWEMCLRAYAAVHKIYTFFAKSSGTGQADVFRDLLSGTVDPTIKYAAYQLRLPRTLSIAQIVTRYIDKESVPVRELLKEDPSALDTSVTETASQKGVDVRELPKTISWRFRTVDIEDANIAQALVSVSTAEQKLASLLSSTKGMSPKDKAAAYDAVLDPSQDAVQATKTAIDELTADGVAAGDRRIQALQITRTAVNYSLVGWRIGRNRALCGRNDGAHLDPETYQSSKKPKKEHKGISAKEESNGRKLARLRERVVLYDSTLQSLDSIQDFPGVAADKSLLDELATKRSYFAALRCLALARSHALLGNAKNALALFARAQTLASTHSNVDKLSSQPKPLGLEVTSEHIQTLQTLLQGLVSQHRALVEIRNLHDEAVALEKSKDFGSSPLIERLDEYPLNGADLSNLVVYPPRLRPIPVKPIFLDVAWNYIDYPGREPEPSAAVSDIARPEPVVEKKEARKGWFGFGK